MLAVRCCPSDHESDHVCEESCTSLPSRGVDDVDSVGTSAGLDGGDARMTGCEDKTVLCVDKKNVHKGVMCSCGQPYKLLSFKKKVRVKNARGDLITISKNATSLRCLDCTAPSSSEVPDDKKTNSTKVPSKGGGLKQMRLGEYFGKQTRPM